MSDPVTPVTQADCWKIGGVSVVGFSHIDEDIPCQDALAFKVKDNGQLIAAVADGAGLGVAALPEGLGHWRLDVARADPAGRRLRLSYIEHSTDTHK